MPGKYLVSKEPGVDSGYVNATFRRSSDLTDLKDTTLSSEYVDAGDMEKGKVGVIITDDVKLQNGNSLPKEDDKKKKKEKPVMVGIGETVCKFI